MIRYVLLLALVATASAQVWTTNAAVDICGPANGNSVGCLPGAAGPGPGYNAQTECCHTNKTSVAETNFFNTLNGLFYTYDTLTFSQYADDTLMGGQALLVGSSGRTLQVPNAANAKIEKSPKISVYDQTLQFSGNDPFLGNNVSFTFDQPIDGFGLYVRDASTADSIVHIYSNNGVVDDFLFHSFNHSNSQDERVADIVYLSAYHTSCDGGARCTKFTFGPMSSEELIGLDNITIAHWGSQCTNSSISGYVYIDGNSNNNRDQGEQGIDNVQIDLKTCSDTLIASTNTDNAGYYLFQELLTPGGCYKLEEHQPAGFNDSRESVGTFSGVPIGNAPNNEGDNVIDQIQVNLGGQTGVNYNFGEATSDPCDAPISADYCVSPSMQGIQNTASVSSDQDGRAVPLHTGVKLIFTKKTNC